MRTLLLASVLLSASALLTAALPGPLPAASAAELAPSTALDLAEARPAARVVLNSSRVVVASLTLLDSDGTTVRTYEDELLWKGTTVLTLDLGDIPDGLYELVVTTPHGTETSPFRVTS